MAQELAVTGPVRLPCLLADGTTASFQLYLYRFGRNRYYHVLQKGDITRVNELLVRIQSACSLSVVFNSQRCDCRTQLEMAIMRINKSNVGLLIYAWPHEGRGIGLWDHMRVYMEQDKGDDTVSSYEKLRLPVDSRAYIDIIKILKYLRIKRVRLLTNNPLKVQALGKAGIEVKRVPLVANLDKYNESQLVTKVKKLGHLLPLNKLDVWKLG